MKHLLLLLMLVITVSSSAFAECNLDTDRWKYLGSTSNCAFYFDTVSLTDNKVSSSFEVWECHYYPGKYSDCELSLCKEKGKNTSEHYHYQLMEYDYNRRTYTLKSILMRDSHGTAFSSLEIPSYLQQTHKIPPDSDGEFVMQRIKDYIDNPMPAKSENVKDEKPLPSIVINNTTTEDVKKIVLKWLNDSKSTFKDDVENPEVLEGSEKVTLKGFLKNGKLETKDLSLSVEERVSIYTTQQGKNVLLRGEIGTFGHFSDGEVVGPTRITIFDESMYESFVGLKKYFNGWYRFGFTKEKTTEGYKIIKVDTGFPFEKKGIQEGDIIISINNQSLKNYSPTELKTKKILDPFAPDALLFLIERNGKRKRYNIKPIFVPPQKDREVIPEEKNKETEPESISDNQTSKPQVSGKTVYLVGDKGWKIKKAQEYLLMLGFDPGETDGRFTKSTRIAIRNFQNKYKLKGMGNLDNATYEELKWQVESKQYRSQSKT